VVKLICSSLLCEAAIDVVLDLGNHRVCVNSDRWLRIIRDASESGHLQRLLSNQPRTFRLPICGKLWKNRGVFSSFVRCVLRSKPEQLVAFMPDPVPSTQQNCSFPRAASPIYPSYPVSPVRRELRRRQQSPSPPGYFGSEGSDWGASARVRSHCGEMARDSGNQATEH
jgi:hypothetical protein